MKKINLLSIGALILLIGGFAIWWLTSAGNVGAKDAVDTSYQKIQIPQPATLSAQVWTQGSLDVASHWTYTYQVNTARVLFYPRVRQNLLAAGYTIDTSDDQNMVYMTAKNQQQHVFLTLHFEPDTGTASPQVSSMIVDAQAF